VVRGCTAGQVSGPDRWRSSAQSRASSGEPAKPPEGSRHPRSRRCWPGRPRSPSARPTRRCAGRATAGPHRLGVGRSRRRRCLEPPRHAANWRQCLLAWGASGCWSGSLVDSGIAGVYRAARACLAHPGGLVGHAAAHGRCDPSVEIAHARRSCPPDRAGRLRPSPPQAPGAQPDRPLPAGAAPRLPGSTRPRSTSRWCTARSWPPTTSPTSTRSGSDWPTSSRATTPPPAPFQW
jgi:hypothetical protein